ncbi:MAG: amidophosphoribosyltransferase [bacterium]
MRNSLWDRLREGCGIFGIYGHPQAAELTYLGLYALQHRGQESTGIVSSDGERMYHHRGMGLVADVFGKQGCLQAFPGHLAIGHNRYSTTGGTLLVNAQPILIRYRDGPLAVAHNGNLVNTKQLRSMMEDDGSIFQTTTDSELILHLVARSKEGTLMGRITDALRQVRGAYSLVFATPKEIVGVRDPHGFRPMCLGRLGGAHVLASESCALDIINAEYVRDIEPGEMVLIDDHGAQSVFPYPRSETSFCIFEYIYFARPDSIIFGQNVDKARRQLGHQLAREQPAQANIVISVPDSSNTATVGYAEESGIRFELGLIRNHYVGRTFIHPSQSTRDIGVLIKFNPVKGVLKGKRIVVVDDSIVRGTTSMKLVRMLRQAGVKQVHFRVSAPPLAHPCFYGIDIPTRKELIASSHSVEQILRFIGADSLGYLSLEGLLKAVPHSPQDYCTACFSGDYRVLPEGGMGKEVPHAFEGAE